MIEHNDNVITNINEVKHSINKYDNISCIICNFVYVDCIY